MDYFLAIFSNRTETQDFASILTRHRINASIISTPNGLGASCGVSVKIRVSDFQKTMKIFKNLRYLTFVGFYKVVNTGGYGYRYETINVYF